MKARDVMVSPVITVKPSSSVKEVAKTFLERRISAAPVVDDQGKLVGIVSEGDLMHRAEAGTERHRSWWLRALTAEETLAAEYVKAHARKVADVMTRDVITATADTPLHEIAALLEKNSIKRVPVVKNGQLVGIVSRANLVQAVASAVFPAILGDRFRRAFPYSSSSESRWLSKSVRHEAADGTCRQQLPRHAAEDPLAQAAVPIGAGDQQIGAFFASDPDQLLRARSLLLQHDFGPAFDAMVREITSYIVEPPQCGLLFARPTCFDNGNARCLLQERKCVPHGSARFARILPPDHDMLGSQRVHSLGHY